MKKGLLFVLLLVSFVGFGQCPTGNIIFNSQAEIDDFLINYPNCTEITENVRVVGGDITNLNGLRNITNINNTFEIIGNPILQSLEGLDNLTHVDNFYIKSSSGLLSFEGLLSLTSASSIEVNYLPNVSNFAGFNNLTTVTNHIDIKNMDSLNSLDGLENLNSVGMEINIFSNNSLISIEALNYVETTIFRIILNQNLSQCAIESICNIIAINPLSLNIGMNASGCYNRAEVEAQCLLSRTEEDFLNHLLVYPNPVSSILNIDILANIYFEKATIYSTLGKPILETSEKQINLETLSAGFYFVEVVTNKGSVTKKIVKN